MRQSGAFDPEVSFERFKPKPRLAALHKHCASREAGEAGFICRHCRQFVSASAEHSGVRNRNHCPYCLWSRHMDLKEAGDRMCTCQASMQPVGLTFKRSYKKYASQQLGEVMLIHVCCACSRISINRIAADDNAALLLETFQASLTLDAGLKSRIFEEGIQLLQEKDRKLLLTRLFGNTVHYRFSSGMNTA